MLLLVQLLHKFPRAEAVETILFSLLQMFSLLSGLFVSLRSQFFKWAAPLVRSTFQMPALLFDSPIFTRLRLVDVGES